MAEVGKAEVRVDAFDKATGRTKYYEDLMPRDALYVRIKHATIAHGFVKSVDTSAAEQIPGVVKVLTCFDVPEHPFPTAGHPWSMDPGHQDVADRHLLNRHVRYYGDDVAVVIAENEVAAMQGVRALQVEYEELPFVLDVQKAMEPGAPQLHEAYPNNILKHTDMKTGDYQAAIREPGLIKVEGWYETPTVQHCHIENHGCFCYEENGGNPLCAAVCPTGAAYIGADGIVGVDEGRCIGCKYCMAACPYQVRVHNEKTGTVDKCRFCTVSAETSGTKMCSCVEACLTGARIFGDLDDPASDISKEIAATNAQPIAGDLTKSKVFYVR